MLCSRAACQSTQKSLHQHPALWPFESQAAAHWRWGWQWLHQCQLHACEYWMGWIGGWTGFNDWLFGWLVGWLVGWLSEEGTSFISLVYFVYFQRLFEASIMGKCAKNLRDLIALLFAWLKKEREKQKKKTKEKKRKKVPILTLSIISCYGLFLFVFGLSA